MDNDLIGTVAHIADVKTAAPTIKGMHHMAYRCRDAVETKKFYVDLLGLKQSAALAFDKSPGGSNRQFMHLFFQMADGNFIAFFDAPDNVSDDAFTLKDGIEDYHFAFEVETEDEQQAFMNRLKEAQVPVFGPIDHHFCHSIYFFDPNGLACEITRKDEKHDEILADEASKAATAMDLWSQKTRALKEARLNLFKAAD